MPAPDAPIGVFDSGLGGLTVVREILRQLPAESILYVADTAHVPYGPRPAHEVRGFALDIMRFLASQGAKAVVAACNMSSALAVGDARRHLDIPVLGVIEAGAALALSQWAGGPIGVLATSGTVASQAYPTHIARVRPDVQVVQVSCPEFVPLVEQGLESSPQALAAATEYMRPLLKAGCQTVILGCTHYPLLLPVLETVAPYVRFIDPAVGAAAQLAACLAERKLLQARRHPPQHRFLATADPDRLARGLSRFLGIDSPTELANIWMPADPSGRLSDARPGPATKVSVS
ncbi:MAG: glutamate racemase [Armatimonadota bacterium]